MMTCFRTESGRDRYTVKSQRARARELGGDDLAATYRFGPLLLRYRDSGPGFGTPLPPRVPRVARVPCPPSPCVPVYRPGDPLVHVSQRTQR
jgi:hypothetical protein